MGKIGLQIKGNLENITNLKPCDIDFRWYFKVKCSSCGEESDKWLYIDPQVTVPLKGGRGDANIVVKCKLCGRENSIGTFIIVDTDFTYMSSLIDILKGSVGHYSQEDSNTFKTIAQFDCRGVELIDFSFRTAEGAESGTKFDEINLSELEWVDYDERSKESVGIYELEHRFVKA